MPKIRIFYDYECPYCKKGYEYLLEEMKGNPEIEIEWRPMEAHPLPEIHSPNTYLACQSYYIAKELGADIHAFHKAMFYSAAIERRDVDKPDVLCDILKGIVDIKLFRSLLDSGKYSAQVDENNDLAYEKSGVWFLPSFRMNDKKLDAKGGEGITPEQLKEFLKT